MCTDATSVVSITFPIKSITKNTLRTNGGLSKMKPTDEDFQTVITFRMEQLHYGDGSMYNYLKKAMRKTEASQWLSMPQKARYALVIATFLFSVTMASRLGIDLLKCAVKEIDEEEKIRNGHRAAWLKEKESGIPMVTDAE